MTKHFPTFKNQFKHFNFHGWMKYIHKVIRVKTFGVLNFIYIMLTGVEGL